jgi:hypothetical protein
MLEEKVKEKKPCESSSVSDELGPGRLTGCCRLRCPSLLTLGDDEIIRTGDDLRDNASAWVKEGNNSTAYPDSCFIRGEGLVGPLFAFDIDRNGGGGRMEMAEGKFG